MDSQLQLKEWIEQSDRIVFFGGAGVSTESGIPDFRSVDGLYHQNYDYPPEKILSHSFFMENTEYFYRFYKEKMLYLKAAPNITHLKLADLEKKNKVQAVITQNIDGLHQLAGSKKVLELHGSIHRNHCMECKKSYDIDNILISDSVPRCNCGGIIKPDVVLYEEPLDEIVINQTIKAITDADMLIVGGTSLSVYPASGFINYYKGKRLVLINKAATPYDSYADLLLQRGLGDVFKEL
jgi:NAD-dependent deacetylase